MRAVEFRRTVQHAFAVATLVAIGTVVPQAVAAQTMQDPAATQNQNMRDMDDEDGMDLGWIGLLGLAGLLGLRRRENVDINTARRTPFTG